MINFLRIRLGVVCAIVSLALASLAVASTGREHEISDIHFENVTPTTVDVVWTTAHPGTSQVVLARDTNYEPERWIPATADPAMVTTHRVTVDHLLPYAPKSSDGQYYVYVASGDGKGALSTAPGPQTQDAKNPLLMMRTAPADPAAPPNFKLYTMGPTEVFPGYDMYFLVQPVLIAGPVGHIYVMHQRDYNNGTDGVVKYLGSGKGNPETISVHFSCAWSNAAGLDSNEQTLSRDRNLGYCPNGNNAAHDLSIRLRTDPKTIPGKYSVTFTVETNGQQQTGSYEFAVMPAATAPAHSPVTPKAIPGLSTWEKQMTALGDKWCAYRDQQNAAGNFVDSWGWTADAWFYDGGRSFENIDSYTAAAGHPNHPHWQHCALTLLDPYANYQVANDAKIAGYSIFSYGMAMNYSRTHTEVMRKAIKMLAIVGPQHVSCGSVDPVGIRENAYRINAWMADEMLGGPRAPLLQRNVDKLMGNINMAANAQLGAAHPFMVGLAMESLIHWYQLSLETGHPDYRVVPVIKEGLDALWRDSWLPKQNTFNYNRYDLPANTRATYTALNNMVSVAYAWYWLQTGDAVERDHGDLLFEHAFDDPGGYGWSGKQFSQEFEFSFDFVRFRQGLTTSSVIPANNPYSRPYADTAPPISEKVNCDPNYFRGCKAGTIGSTTATIFWNTYKPSTTQVIVGTTTNYGLVSDVDKAMVLSHVVNLAGLQPNTTYHFRTKSVDGAGNVGSMHDLTFTTQAAQPSGSHAP